MNEEQTKLELITPALQKAGWGSVQGSRILMEQRACLIAPGRVGKVRGKLKKAGFADAESLVPQRGRAVMFPLSRIKWRNCEMLAVSVGCELVCVNL